MSQSQSRPVGRPRVTPGGWAAAVTFHEPGHEPEALTLAEACILPAAEVAAFVAWACAAAPAVATVWGERDAGVYPEVPEFRGVCPGILPDRLTDRSTAPRGASARAAWLYLFDLKTRADCGRISPKIARHLHAKVGYDLHVHPGPAGTELGFKLYSPDGKVVSWFDIARGPADEVVAILRGPDVVDALASL
jgi:hypothetical protein